MNPAWMHRAEQAFAVLKTDLLLAAQVRSEVDAFFAAHPEEPDTAASRDILTGLVFRRLTSGTAENQKVA